MLISLKHKFIFIANLKTASTAIEASLSHICEIAIRETQFGKHCSLSEVIDRFSWIFEYIPREEFFVFGVMRDPVDFVVSLYNAHKRNPQPGRTTGLWATDFDEFVDGVVGRGWQAKPQSRRLIDPTGRLNLSEVVMYDDLAGGYERIVKRLQLPARPLLHKNVSPKIMDRDTISPSSLHKIKSYYAEDYDFIQSIVANPKFASI